MFDMPSEVSLPSTFPLPYGDRVRVRGKTRRVKKIKIRNLIWVVMAAAIITGCAAKQKDVELIWPLPPDPPRIKYLYSVSSSDDVKEDTFGKTLRETIIGKDAASALAKPYAVHADNSGRILVADSAWGKVLVFDRENHKFSIIGESGAGMLSKPLGITSDSQHNVYVTDSAQNRVIVYDKDGTFIKP